MTQEEYAQQAQEMYDAPFDNTTIAGQKFNVGDIVKIVNPTSWFSKKSVEEDKDMLFEIEYSYQQKYGHMSMSNAHTERHLNQYSLIRVHDGSSTAWYDGEELKLNNND